MADAVVNYVLGKIGDATYQEILRLYGLEEKIDWARRELRLVSAFLKDAEAKQNKDAMLKQWVKEVREVAFMIEDTLDKFLAEVGGPKKGILERARRMSRKLIARYKVVNEIDNIRKRMADIDESRRRLGILSIESSSSSDHAGQQYVRPLMIPEIDQTDIVGFKDDINNICNLLLDERDLRHYVVSIVEAGGRGKTAVATKVYKSAKVESHFDICIWITVSKEWTLTEVLIKILEKLIKGVNIAEMRQKSEEFLITEVHKLLSSKKYDECTKSEIVKRFLVVLDDVWSPDLWTQLRVALPQTNNGSRVLITTRSRKVAEKADAKNEPYQLRVLNKEESVELLLKKAFPNKFAEKCPDNLIEQANLLAQNCGGWPLALVVLGGILSTKYPDCSTWDETMRRLDWNSDDNDLMDIISTSFDDLPVHLKPCFMYFASFLEDSVILVSRLIRMWIAEGFIRQETRKTMEESAINYLEELVQRCMVQAFERSLLGEMISCRIHDILHELAIEKAEENDFLRVYSKSTANSSISAPRRAAYHVVGNTGATAAIGPNLRSLFYFGDDMPDCNELRISRVVDLEFRGFKVDAYYNAIDLDLKWLQQLGATLRYLVIRNISGLRIKCNSSCLAHLKHLQMLETRSLQFEYEEHNKKNITFWKKHCSFLPWQKNNTSETSVSDDEGTYELPESLWNNKMLRSVSCKTTLLLGPPSSTNLENLQNLEWVMAREEWAVKLPYFPEIRELRLYLKDVEHCWEVMSNLMSRLENLISLTLLWFDRKEHMTIVTPAFREYKQMRFLELSGPWPENAVIDGSLFPPNLVRLKLEYPKLREDPMPELEKLPHLKLLELGRSSYMGEKLICSRAGFTCLEKLDIYSLYNLEELKLEEGAMPMLKELLIWNCEKLEMVPNLQYLKNLRELKVRRVSEVFISRLNGEDQHKVEHIPSRIIQQFKSTNLSDA